MELEITWRRVIRVWWSYVWRNLIAIIVSMLIGMVVGLSWIHLGSMGVPVKTIQIVVAPLGFAMAWPSPSCP
jgi:hypothetical protein